MPEAGCASAAEIFWPSRECRTVALPRQATVLPEVLPPSLRTPGAKLEKDPYDERRAETDYRRLRQSVRERRQEGDSNERRSEHARRHTVIFSGALKSSCSGSGPDMRPRQRWPRREQHACEVDVPLRRGPLVIERATRGQVAQHALLVSVVRQPRSVFKAG